ncbi:MAG: bifunctional tetrahydrofolate synthase/dihydrofolate synthase [Rudaea sp.]
MRSLADWLEYQQRIHPRDIELGLDRVREVWNRMGAPAPAATVITVGGTNGKGSTVAFLESILIASGCRVGSFTSPHLLRYNERIRVFGKDADDASLVAAFERIESARAEIPLTYFEFGTLAALWIFAQSRLDVAVLEVGLGGRLDAVNIIDADAAIVTTVDLDHQDWLGRDVDTIGREKAGIFRQGRPAIIGTSEPPSGLIDEAERIGADLIRRDVDFRTRALADSWVWETDALSLELPLPALAASAQVGNAASAIAALHCLRQRIAWNPDAISSGVRDATIAARLQRFTRPACADLIVDVGHNPQAARMLARYLSDRRIAGKTIAVFGALSDKDVGGIVASLHEHVARWIVGGLDTQTPRGLRVEDLRDRMHGIDTQVIDTYLDIDNALDAALEQSGEGDRIIAFGSFFVAACALTWAARNGYGAASGASRV